MTQRNLFNFNASSLNMSQRLSTGIRINSAADDAANLSLSKKISSENRGLKVANLNLQISLEKLNTYESSYSSALDDLQRMRDLAVQAANGTNSASERNALSAESSELKENIVKTREIAHQDLALDSDLMKGVARKSYDTAIANGYDDAHIIKDASEFQTKISADMAGDFILMDNINMAELGTLSDSAITGTFSGNFDGNGYAINNLKIDSTASSVGLFSQTSGTIENLALKNATITSTGDQVGGITGFMNGGSIQNSSALGVNINGDNQVGGLAGETNGGSIQNSYTTGGIHGTLTGAGTLTVGAGGIAGLTDGTNIQTSYSSAAVSGEDNIGGFIGWTAGTNISNCYASGNITAYDTVDTGSAGGFVAVNDAASSITSCYATGNVKAGRCAGGFVGFNRNSSIDGSFSTGNVSGTFALGGFAGVNQLAGASITNSDSSGNVSGTNVLGGFIGFHQSGATIDNSFSTGNVSGDNTIGGFAGRFITGATATNCYAKGTVSGNTIIGGFVGSMASAASNIDATNSWNSDSTTTGIGTLTSGTFSAIGVSGNSMAAGQNISESWSSSTWNFKTGAPSLKKEATTMSIQIGSQADSSSQANIEDFYMDLSGLVPTLNFSTQADARAAIESIDSVINALTSQEAGLGSQISNLQSILKTNTDKSLNLTESNSTIKDTDMALEAAKLAKNQILTQSAMSILQQSQQIKAQSVLSFY